MKCFNFYIIMFLLFLMGCTGPKDKSIYIETINLTSDYESCYKHNLLRQWNKNEINEMFGKDDHRENIEDITFYPYEQPEKDVQNGREKITVTVRDTLHSEGAVYYMEHFVREKDNWISRGGRKEFKVMKIHPENKSPYGLDVDEVCEQMVSNTIKIALE